MNTSPFRGLYGIVGADLPATQDRTEATLHEARTLLAAGVRVVQLRDKQADGRTLVALTRALVALCREAGALCIVNDRLDVALAGGADGVHLGQDDLPVEAARQVLRAAGRRDLLIGLSTHDTDQVRAAVALRVDYLGFGPVYGTRTKADALSPRGLVALEAAVRQAAPLPVVAIGGITRESAPHVAATGVAMAAVIGDIRSAPDPVVQAKSIHGCWTLLPGE